MNKYVEQFSALGHEDRLKIFRLLVRTGPQGNCVDDIKRRLRMPGSTLSHHLEALTRSGLLTAKRSGRFIFYAVSWPVAANLIRFLTKDCCADMHIEFTSLGDSKVPEAPNGKRRVCCAEGETIVPQAAGTIGAKRKLS
jgi:ArsR family transcriptional regulator